MNSIAHIISTATGLPEKSVANTIKLLEDGATIPFICRYRKEATGGLNEVQIQLIAEKKCALDELLKRKEFIIKSIESAGKLTPELATKIDNCFNSNELEDIYLPFKPKRRTRAEVARSLGLEPLARIIMAQHSDNITAKAKTFITPEVADSDAAIKGACDIIAEWISEDKRARNYVRASFRASARISSSVIKGKEEEGAKYMNYFEFTDFLPRISSHRLLAMLRGEKEGFLKLSISNDNDHAIENIKRILIKNDSQAASIVESAIEDSYKRLIRPSIETEFLSEAKSKSDDDAVALFAQNVRQLLFAPPLGAKRVLAIDPGFRTGCKVVCLDQQGNLLHDCVIYPTPPHNDTQAASTTIINLVKKFNIDVISLGNGTASRETESFLKKIHFDKDVKIYIVNENGASIYSASQVAREEFPDKDVTVRGAVSIGRRLLDPLAELVKIDPKSIGVGQYQHDVDQTKLRRALAFVVESCVNSVGVNVNTASVQLLSYVSGLGPTLAQNIVKYRSEHGDFTSRNELLKVPRMGEKAFKLSAGFLRIPSGKNPLDNSAVHPERYALVRQMAADCNCSVAQLINDADMRKKIDLQKYVSNDVGLPTLNDIMAELEKPGRDPRADFSQVEFNDKIQSIDDIAIDMVLSGVVTNITQFGIFVDIGIHIDGLVHISEMSNRYISHPSEVANINDRITVKVIGIDKQRNRISLSMKGL